jgi:pimeloyl-ACP methyl ester carboxylesterase
MAGKKFVRWAARILGGAGLVLLVLMHSCMQFRMSSSAIEKHFQTTPYTARQYTYIYEGQKIKYVAVGDSTRPTVLFVHGSPGSLSAFIDFLGDTVLAKRAQLISVDRPGFGDSNFGVGERSLQKQARALLPILQKAAPGPVILVGHSLGGPVIARVAMDYPQHVQGLIFVAASIDPALEPNEAWFRRPLATPFLRWILPRSLRASNEELYHLKPELQEMVPLWANITAPSVVIQGGKDVLVPPANADFARKHLTRAPVSFVLPPDVNHFIPWTNPKLIRAAVLQLLAAASVSTRE